MINSERRGKEMFGCIFNSSSVVVTVYTAFFLNIQELCISPTRSMCMYVFPTIIRINSSYFLPQHYQSCLCNEDVCFLRGRSYIFNPLAPELFFLNFSTFCI